MLHLVAFDFAGKLFQMDSDLFLNFFLLVPSPRRLAYTISGLFCSSCVPDFAMSLSRTDTIDLPGSLMVEVVGPTILGQTLRINIRGSSLIVAFRVIFGEV